MSSTATTLSGKDFHTLRGSLDPIPVGVILFDPEGRPLVANRAARDLLGDVATLPLSRWAEVGTFLQPNGEKAGFLDLPPCQSLRDGGVREEIELWFQNGGDVPLPLLVSSRAVKDPEGDVAQVACSLTPIPAQRRRSEQACLSQRMEAVSSLVAGAAGPLNDALTAIKGYCELALGRVDDANPLKGVLEEIRQAGERASVLTGRLMAHGRREVSVPQIVDLDRWLSTHVTALHALVGDAVELEVQPGSGGARVRADTNLLHQMLADLLGNAREAMPDGGRVRISTAPVSVDPAVARLLGEDQGSAYVALTVSDSGGGMAEPVLRRIFEPFFTTKPGALGLGLATVERLARAQGGTVRVTNRRGDGASFHVHLPRVSEEEAAAAGADAPEEGAPAAAQRRLNVLLLEDDVVVRDLVHEVLEMRGCHVREARNALELNHVVDTWEGDPPDLLVSDVVLPGEGGQDVAARLRIRFPALKVLLMSGCNDPDLLAPTLSDPHAAFLPKPFSPGALMGRVDQLFR